MHNSRYLLTSIAVICLAAVLAACGGQTATPSSTAMNPTETVEPESQVEPTAPVIQPTETEFTSPLDLDVSPLPAPTDKAAPADLAPLDPEATPLTGEVSQDLLDAVIDDLVERLGVDREAITVEQSGVVVWRDGSLGCPQPGMMYTQALVPGYRIILSVGEMTYDYHASEGGTFLLCAPGMAEEPLPPGDGGLSDR